MAASVSPSALLCTPATHPRKLNQLKAHLASSPPKPLLHSSACSTTLSNALAAATSILLLASSPAAHAAGPESPFQTYYGTAASAANYGGYGGNASKKDSAEYIYEVPAGWKERLVSKVEKGTNGTDSEFYNPRKRTEREYLTFLAGFRSLAPVDTVLSNLALSDVNLQDQIAGADAVMSSERKDGNGQLYYDYEIEGAESHSLIAVTCAKNKLYAHFVTAPNQEWRRDQEMLRRLHSSFVTVDFTAPPPVSDT